MKRLSFTVLLVSISFFTYAQNKFGSFEKQFPSIDHCVSSEARASKGKFLTFGFDLGINRSDLKFGDVQSNGDQITNGMGYRLGIISNLQFTKKFSFAPKAELSFNATRLDKSNTSYNVNGVNLEFIGHFKYNLFKSGFTPYLLTGPNFRVPLNNQEEEFVPTKEDIALDFGIGLDIPLRNFKVSPELRYSYGLMNITESESYSDLKYNNISLVLVFTGK